MVLKYRVIFRDIDKKIKGYKTARLNLRKNVRKEVKWYGTNIHKQLVDAAPTFGGKLKGAIVKLPLSLDNIIVTLKPFIRYWMFQEFGVTPQWVLVDTKPELKAWIEKKGLQNKTKQFWLKEEKRYGTIFKIGGSGTRLGTVNRFAYKGREFIEKNHMESLIKLEKSFIADLPLT